MQRMLRSLVSLASLPVVLRSDIGAQEPPFAWAGRWPQSAYHASGHRMLTYLPVSDVTTERLHLALTSGARRTEIRGAARASRQAPPSRAVTSSPRQV
jgi:hypothetical protein